MKLLIASFMCVSVCSYAQVRMSYYGDTLKGSIKKMTEYRFNWIDTIKGVYTCDMNTGIQTATFYSSYSRGGRPFGKWLVKYDNNGRTREASLFYGLDSICRNEAYKYDANGRKIEQRFVDCRNRQCNQINDVLSGIIREWISGEFVSVKSDKYEYDSNSRLVSTKTEIFDSGGSVTNAMIDTTFEITTYKYYSNGVKVAEMEKEFFRITPGSADTTFEITDSKYDNKGNKVEEDVLNKGRDNSKNWYSDGKEITSKTLYSYDAHNNLVEDKGYFVASDDGNSKPHTGTKVGGGSVYTFDSVNNMTSRNFYHLYRQEDGSETKEVYRTQDESWTSKNEKREEDQKEYDRQGNIIKITNGGITMLRREIEYF